MNEKESEESERLYMRERECYTPHITSLSRALFILMVISFRSSPPLGLHSCRRNTGRRFHFHLLFLLPGQRLLSKILQSRSRIGGNRRLHRSLFCINLLQGLGVVLLCICSTIQLFSRLLLFPIAFL